MLGEVGRGLHLAVMGEPYLSMALAGVKTVESRLSRTRRAPWGVVARRDLLLLKKASGPVVGVAEVGEVWGYEVGEGGRAVGEIRREFDGRVRGEPAYWAARREARYATLLELARVEAIPGVECEKRDRNAWVVLRGRA
jgi:hypothetical protein